MIRRILYVSARGIQRTEEGLGINGTRMLRTAQRCASIYEGLMVRTEEPSRLLVDSLDDIAATLGDLDVEVSAAMKWKLVGLRFLHPFGFHYLVPTYQFDHSSRRMVMVGTSCWFCNG